MLAAFELCYAWPPVYFEDHCRAELWIFGQHVLRKSDVHIPCFWSPNFSHRVQDDLEPAFSDFEQLRSCIPY
jgi:hypothetical protein